MSGENLFRVVKLFSIGMTVWAIGSAVFQWKVMKPFIGLVNEWSLASLSVRPVSRIIVPYPGLPDLFYVLTPFLIAVGIYYLYREMKSNPIREMGFFGDLLAACLVLTIVTIIVPKPIPSEDSTNKMWAYMWNLLYPSIDVVNWTFIGPIIFGPFFRRLSRTFAISLLIIFLGLIGIHVADAAYSVTTTISEKSKYNIFAYYPGNFVDAMFLVSYTLFGTGILMVPLAAPYRR